MFTYLSINHRRTSGESSVASKSNESQLAEEEKLTKEEWQAINEMLSYQPDEDTSTILGKDVQSMIQYLVEVSIGKAAARIININETEIVCGRFEQLYVTTKLYPKSIHCNVSLKCCGLSSPEGSLAEVCLIHCQNFVLLISCHAFTLR